MVFTLSGEADMISTCLDECCNRQDVIEFFWTLTEEEVGFGVKSKYKLHLLSLLIMRFPLVRFPLAQILAYAIFA